MNSTENIVDTVYHALKAVDGRPKQPETERIVEQACDTCTDFLDALPSPPEGKLKTLDISSEYLFFTAIPAVLEDNIEDFKDFIHELASSREKVKEFLLDSEWRIV